MRKTAIFNQKGGVAKTTSCIYLANALSKGYGAKVLLVDCDPQCNLSQFMGQRDAKQHTAGCLISGSVDYAMDSIRHTRMQNVDILPASDKLMELDLSAIRGGSVKPYIFRMLCIELAKKDQYDYVFFDCPAAFNSASVAALMAADDVIVPIKIDAFSVEGMTFIMRQIQTMQQANPGLKVAGILPTMFTKNPKVIEGERILRNQHFPILPHVRRNAGMDEMTFSGELGSNHTAPIIDYRRVAGFYVRGESV